MAEGTDYHELSRRALTGLLLLLSLLLLFPSLLFPSTLLLLLLLLLLYHLRDCARFKRIFLLSYRPIKGRTAPLRKQRLSFSILTNFIGFN